jgi:hypothetical protein
MVEYTLILQTFLEYKEIRIKYNYIMQLEIWIPDLYEHSNRMSVTQTYA